LHQLGVPIPDALWFYISLGILLGLLGLFCFFIIVLCYQDIQLERKVPWYSHLPEIPFKLIKSVIATFIVGIFSFLVSSLIVLLTVDSPELSMEDGTSIASFALILLTCALSVFLMYVILRLSLYTLAILLENRGIVESLKRSYKISRGWRQWLGTGGIFAIQQFALLVIGLVLLWLWEKWMPTALANTEGLLFWGVELVLTAVVSLWSVLAFAMWFEELAQRASQTQNPATPDVVD